MVLIFWCYLSNLRKYSLLLDDRWCRPHQTAQWSTCTTLSIGSSHWNCSNARLVWQICNLQGAEFGQLNHPPTFGPCFFFHGDRFTACESQATYNLESQTLKATAVATNMYFTRDAETLKIYRINLCSYKTSRTQKLKNSKNHNQRISWQHASPLPQQGQPSPDQGNL